MSPQGRRAGQEAARAAEQAARAARQIAERIASTAARTGAKAGGLPADAIVAMPVERELVLYRLVRQDPRIFEAFLSNLAKGKRPFPDEWFILRGGVSMFEHAEQALSIAKGPPMVAAVTLEPGCGFHVSKTRGPGHYTVWGDPEHLHERATLVHHDP